MCHLTAPHSSIFSKHPLVFKTLLLLLVVLGTGPISPTTAQPYNHPLFTGPAHDAAARVDLVQAQSHVAPPVRPRYVNRSCFAMGTATSLPWPPASTTTTKAISGSSCGP